MNYLIILIIDELIPLIVDTIITQDIFISSNIIKIFSFSCLVFNSIKKSQLTFPNKLLQIKDR